MQCRRGAACDTGALEGRVRRIARPVALGWSLRKILEPGRRASGLSHHLRAHYATDDKPNKSILASFFA
jgi:hypothetical protein